MKSRMIQIKEYECEGCGNKSIDFLEIAKCERECVLQKECFHEELEYNCDWERRTSDMYCKKCGKNGHGKDLAEEGRKRKELKEAVSNMRLVILANETMQDAKVLVNLENQEVLLSGDEYHDKISAKIKGFIEGLNIAGAKYKVIKEGVLVDEVNEEFYNGVLYIQPGHPWFTLVGFFEEE